jgi:hypothetical protein
VDLIPGADVAGVLLVKKGGEFESLAETDGLAARLDKLQHDFGEGPCAQAALEQTIVRSDDLRKEPRWPRYAPAAIGLGVLSGLSFKLYTADRTAGALLRPPAPCSPRMLRPRFWPGATRSSCKRRYRPGTG